MPREVAIDDDAAVSLADGVAQLERIGFDPRDETSFLQAAPVLKRLANNRRLLADHAIAALENWPREPLPANGYGAQSMMLHRAERWFIRANFWPATTDSAMRGAGAGAFVYGIPHDHNFSFLTIGYLGPGYWSEYYEYEQSALHGYPGEPAGLRFVERSRLAQGRMLFYRAGRDVHVQQPGESMSVSLNIVEASPSLPWRDQYRFDVERGTVAGILNRASIEPLLALAAAFGGEDARALLDDTAARHPSDRIRFRAIEALAQAADPAARHATLVAGTRDRSALVAGHCRALLGIGGASRATDRDEA